MAIKTRETNGTGVTNNGAPLTNAELDNNFIELVAEDASKLDKSGGTMTGSLITGSSITLNGAQQGGYPSISLQSGSGSHSFIQMGTSSDPDEGTIQYTPLTDQMSFTAGTVNAFNIKSTGPQLGRDLDMNSYVFKQGSAGAYQRTLSTSLIDCGATGGFSMYLGYQGTYSFDITNGEFNQNFERVAKFTMNSSCDLYHDGTLKFKTQSYGIVVYGDATNGSGAIQLNCENNSHGVKIKAPPHSAAATYTLTLPTSAGTSGQVLTTNGSGTLSWTTPSSGGGGSGIANVVDDTSPQLGGDLDLNNERIIGTGSIRINGDIKTHSGTYGDLTWDHSNGTLHLGDDSWLGMGSTSSTPDVVLVGNPANGGYTFQIMDRNYSNPTIAIGIDPTAGQAVFYNGVKKFETTSAGATVTGALTATGDVTAFSDARLKENIETIDNALDKVCGLRGVSYDKDGEKGIGVIAQEVEEIIPEVVGTHDDKDATRTVAYGNMVGVLIEAIKEQQKQIEELKGRVTELGGYD